jgi:3-hydroxyisobutyrate dehydrogenase
MARRIANSGFELTLWARRPETLEPYADTPATRADSPAALGRASDVVGICVVGDADVEEVLLGDDGVLQGMCAGGVVAIHSTIHPDTCTHVAERAARRGIGVIDAPVSGGGGAAERQTLLVMVGGEKAHLDRYHPVLDTFADPVIHLGPLGAGQMAKLVNNVVFTALVTVSLETFALADQLGIDRHAMAEVLAHGSGGSRASVILASSGFDTSGMRQALGNLRKDVRIMTDVARAQRIPEPDTIFDLAGRSLEALADGDGTASS